MRALIADLVWERKRDHKSAELAVEAYLQSAARLDDPENWSPAAMRLTRALKLARMLRNDELTKKALSGIEAVLAKYNGSDPLYLSANLMELLLEVRAGEPDKYASLAGRAAKMAEASGDWRRARIYLEIKAKWLARGGARSDANAAVVEAAETHLTEAKIHEESGAPNYMIVTYNLECAIKLLRTIPGQTQRVQELLKRLFIAQSLTTSQLRNLPQRGFQPALLAVVRPWRFSQLGILDEMMTLKSWYHWRASLSRLRNHFQIAASAYFSKWRHPLPSAITGSFPSNRSSPFSWRDGPTFPQRSHFRRDSKGSH
jgi:hypothetical protein